MASNVLRSHSIYTSSTEIMAATLRANDTIFPKGSWDVHHHIIDPQRFTYSAERHLAPPPATIDQFLAFKAQTGITNSVLTHGLSYGSDCSSLLAFVAELGRTNTKGVGVIDPDATPDEVISQMHEAGVRGIRDNLYKYQAMHDLERQKLALREHARRIERYPGWSMAFTHLHPEFWADLRPVVQKIADNGIRIVTDHFALLKGASMTADVTSQPGFGEIMSLVRDGLLWVKLYAPYRVSEQAPLYEDLKPLVRAFVDANPARVLYGSDWPHTPRMKVRTKEDALAETLYLEIDDVAWLRTLRSWLSEDEWEQMTVRNPAELYDW